MPAIIRRFSPLDRARLAAFFIVSLLIIGSCRDDITGPRHNPQETPQEDISDAIHNGGNPHFYFLPPMVRQPKTSGIADGSLNPVVLVCEWNEAEEVCVTTVAGFSREVGTGSELIRYDAAGEHYIVNWHTDRCVDGPCVLDAAKGYRLSVYVGASRLGYADVRPVKNASELRNVQTDEFIGLVNGRTLPVKFRIEQGALNVLQPGHGATISAAGGAVTTTGGEATLEIPAGAVSGAVAITINPATSFPDGPGDWAQPMEFGPSGTQFEKPVTISLSFDPEKIPDAVELQDLGIYHFDGEGWVLVGNSKVDEDLGVVRAEIEHFSTYSIMIRPNTISGEPTPQTIAIGDSVVVSGLAQYYETKTGQTCRKLLFIKLSCTTHTTTYTYPSTAAVYWVTDSKSAVSVVLGPTYPNKNGIFSSPPIVGRSRGVGLVQAGTCSGTDFGKGYCLGEWAMSNLIRFTVWERLTVSSLFSPAAPPLGPDQVVTLTVAIPAPRSSAVPVTLGVAGNEIAVRLSPRNVFDFPQDEGHVISDGETVTFALPAGQVAALVELIGRGLGSATLGVSAPEYFGVPEAAFEVNKGRLRLEGVPATIQVGDSVEVTLTVLRPDGEPAEMAAEDGRMYAQFDINTDAPVEFREPAKGGWGTSVKASGGDSFWMRAVAAGTGDVAAKRSDYEYDVHHVTVEPGPPKVVVEPTLSVITAGDNHSCGLTFAGEAYCWGAGNFGQLGNGGNVDQSAPVRVAGDLVFMTISAGAAHTCALTQSGQAYCWGAAAFGKLGTVAPNTLVPNPVTGGLSFTMISAGDNHTCAVTSGGQAYCWGSNAQGRLGNGTTNGAAVPVLVSGGHTFATIAAGGSHSCAVTTAGAAYCWGWAGRGQVGHGSGVDQWSPHLVSGGHAFVSITAGREHSCGVTESGAGMCWGQNNYGQLGIGASGDRGVPTVVVGGHTFEYLSARTYTTCGVTSGGQVYCFGNNDNGQIGDGSTTPRGSPTLAGNSYSEVGAGGSHSCAINLSGAAHCWGQNSGGQLGTNSTEGKTTPTLTMFSRNPTGSVGVDPASAEVVVGGTVALGATVRDVNGQTVARPVTWASQNQSIATVSSVGVVTGEAVGGTSVTVASGGFNASAAVTVVEGLAMATQLLFTSELEDVVAGAIAPSVQVTVADGGGNAVAAYSGTVALSLTENSAGGVLIGTLIVPIVNGVASFDDLQIEKAGTGYTLLAEADGLAAATSTAFSVAPGAPATLAFLTQPSNAWVGFPIEPAVEVAVHDEYGNVVSHSDLQIMLALEGAPAGADLIGVTTVAAVNGIAVFEGVQVNRTGEEYALVAVAPTPTNSVTEVLTEPFAVSAFQSVSAGRFHSCGLSNIGDAYCWGVGGRLGDGSNLSSSTPVQVLGGHTFTQISAGDGHTCAVTAGGSVHCWGAGGWGQRGDGTNTLAATAPVPVTGGLSFRSVSAGLVHTCGLAEDGSVHCWGYNGSGQLGDGTTTARSAPVPVLEGLTFAAVGVGQTHSCGVTLAGAAYCWGGNFDGRLGNGTTESSYSPVAVAGGISFAAVSAGGFHTCGLTPSGVGYCWGNNFDGRLGDGTTVHSNVPTAVSGGLAFQSIQAGSDYSCAVTSTGAGYCWGRNSIGQLGDGTTVSRMSPGQVSGGLTFGAISVGWTHSCALTSGSVAFCWGNNDNGQLGDGTTDLRLAPVQVTKP